MISAPAQPLEGPLLACVYNRAEAPEEVLMRAQGVTQRIFRAARVDLRWVDCLEAARMESAKVYLRLVPAIVA